MRLALLALALAACGTEPDDRPVTFAVVTFEVLAPSCGEVQCHSTTTRQEGYAFDTLDAARDTMMNRLHPIDILDVITTDDAGRRMPADGAMDRQDVSLIRQWISLGEPGL